MREDLRQARREGVTFKIVTLLACGLCGLQCSRSHSDPEPAGSGAAAATADAPVGPGSTSPDPVPAPPAPPNRPLRADASDGWHTILSHEPLARSIPAGCRDPRVVLSDDLRSDATALTRVRETLIAFPEFLVVEAMATRPREVELYRTLYGAKRFAQGSPPPAHAVIASCADAQTCNALAAVFTLVSPRHAPQPFCGPPPGEIPWQSPSPRWRPASLSPASLGTRPPDDGGPPSCARLIACTARVQRASLPADTCRKLGRDRLRVCAALADCPDVVHCAAQVAP